MDLCGSRWRRAREDERDQALHAPRAPRHAAALRIGRRGTVWRGGRDALYDHELALRAGRAQAAGGAVPMTRVLFMERFLAVVAERQDAVAVESDATRLTYRELSARAAQLGEYLQTLGARPEWVVGLGL